MRQLLLTDFIKNRVIRLGFFFGVMCDLYLSQSIKHMVVIFGLPYLISIGLEYLFSADKRKSQDRGNQYSRVKKSKPYRY